MKILSVIVPFVILAAFGYLYYSVLPPYKKLQLKAYAARDLRVNEKIRIGDFYTELKRVDSANYTYSSPQGMFAKADIRAKSVLDNSNTGLQSQSYIISSPVRVPVTLASEAAQVVRLGDEIALAINGKVFPERNPATKYFMVLDILPDKAKESTTLFIEVAVEHLSDSLWLKDADDHIVPIIINRAVVPACPSGYSPEWIKDPVSLRGKYACTAVQKTRKKAKKCPCESAVPTTPN